MEALIQVLGFGFRSSCGRGFLCSHPNFHERSSRLFFER